MVKKLYHTLLLFCALLLLASCAPSLGEEEEVLQNDEDSPVETAVVPGQSLEEDTYRMISPYRVSEARGVIVTQVANRVDIDEIEEGLRRHSTEVFDPDNFYFQEGRYISSDKVIGWIDEHNPNRDDNWDRKKHEDNPRIFSHVLEQNYLKLNDDKTVELAGISIGIALKSVYGFSVDGNNYTEDISMDEMLEKGNEVAEVIVEDLRGTEGLEDVPILISLYREEAQTSPVPGNFVTKTVVQGGSSSVGDWKSIDEDYVLFPSTEAQNNHVEDHEVFNSFGNAIAKFFPNYVGAIGEGFYVNDELEQLTIEIPIEFYGKAEVIGFTQFVYDEVQDIFDNYYDLEINITSSNKVESLIYRNAKEEQPTIHIYH